jgi:DNA mismatch repair protein MSH5
VDGLSLPCHQRVNGNFEDREIEIVQALLEKVCVYQQEIGDVCDACAELDCLLSFATAAHAYDYRRPTMMEDPVIDIVGGRSVT